MSNNKILIHTYIKYMYIKKIYCIKIIYTLPITSEALKAVIKITGIHDPSLQEIISDIIPGYKQSVTKYANPILPMYGNIIFATSNLASKPS